MSRERDTEIRSDLAPLARRIEARPRPGDRVRVTYEGVYREPAGGPEAITAADGYLVTIDLEAATSVEILPPPEPPEGTTVIGHEQESDRGANMPWVFQKTETSAAAWHTINGTASYTFEEVWERTAVDRQIILPKTP